MASANQDPRIKTPGVIYNKVRNGDIACTSLGWWIYDNGWYEASYSEVCSVSRSMGLTPPEQ